VPSEKAENIGNATNREGKSTTKTNTIRVSAFLELATLGLLNFLSKDGQILFEGNFNLDPKTVITAKIVKETAIRIRLTKTNGPSPRFSVRALLMKTGPFSKPLKTPFSKVPATIRVAPVSEIDLANAKINEDTRLGLRIERVTVRSAVKGDAPNVRDASSKTI
jgi:hypothetical protein